MNEEVLYKVENTTGIITLNRPERLNALNHNIVQKMSRFLDKCESDDDIKCVIIEGAGEKAFCAGGDVVSLRKQVLDEGGPPTELSENFFYDEYLLNYKINNFKKPYIALIDGVTMGGGVGVSMHGSHIVCTERTMFAMPETTIGLFPWCPRRCSFNQGLLSMELIKTSADFLASVSFHLSSTISTAFGSEYSPTKDSEHAPRNKNPTRKNKALIKFDFFII